MIGHAEQGEVEPVAAAAAGIHVIKAATPRTRQSHQHGGECPVKTEIVEQAEIPNPPYATTNTKR
jgi:hypothetical protein